MRLLTLLLALVAALAAPARAGGPDGWTAAWASAQMVPADDQVVPQRMARGCDAAHGRARRAGRAAAAAAAVERPRHRATGDRRSDGRAIGGQPYGADRWRRRARAVRRTGVDGDPGRRGSMVGPDRFPGHRRGRPGHLDPPSRRADSADRPPRLARDDLLRARRPARAADLLARRPRRAGWCSAGIEVFAPEARAVVAFGDSITDGYGVQPDTNLRWTDHLAARLRADPAFAQVALLNEGIGGNRLLNDGLGPNALARFERDVLSQPGVTHVIVLEGVNDLGTLTRDAPASAEQHAALVTQAIEALRQIALRARAHGIKAIGATILPFGTSTTYHPDATNEADRQAINAWIRAPGNFDAVIDFDAALRDPANPIRLESRARFGRRTASLARRLPGDGRGGADRIVAMKPKLLTTLPDYTARLFLGDLVAGISVALVAIPLSIAIAIASGAPPAAGLVTAIVAGS